MQLCYIDRFVLYRFIKSLTTILQCQKSAPSIKIANAIFSRKFDANVIILLFLVHEVPDYFVGNGDIAYD